MTNNLLDWLPADGWVDEDTFTDQQRDSIAAVLAIEEEWIIEPELRAEVTLISWLEDDEE